MTFSRSTATPSLLDRPHKTRADAAAGTPRPVGQPRDNPDVASLNIPCKSKANSCTLSSLHTPLASAALLAPLHVFYPFLLLSLPYLPSSFTSFSPVLTLFPLNTACSPIFFTFFCFSQHFYLLTSFVSSHSLCPFPFPPSPDLPYSPTPLLP